MLRFPVLPALLALTLMSPVLALAEDANPPHHNPHDGGGPDTKGVLGYLDPKTGAFRPAASGGDPSTTLTSVDGKIVVNITIGIRTPGLGIKKIECDVYSEPSYENDEYDGRFVSVGVSGSSVACNTTTTIHWQIDPMNDKLGIYFYVYAYNASGFEVRYLEHLVTTTGIIPTGNSTTTYNVFVAL